MRISESKIQPCDDQMVGFSGERVDTKGFIDLYTTFDESIYICITIKIRYICITNIFTNLIIILVVGS